MGSKLTVPRTEAKVARAKGESEAPSNGGKEEWVRGLLSLEFWREHCGAAKGIREAADSPEKRLKIAKVLLELSTNRDSLVNVNSGQKAAYELIIAVHDWE